MYQFPYAAERLFLAEYGAKDEKEGVVASWDMQSAYHCRGDGVCFGDRSYGHRETTAVGTVDVSQGTY